MLFSRPSTALAAVSALAVAAFVAGFAVAAHKNNFVYRLARDNFLSRMQPFDPTSVPHWKATKAIFDDLKTADAQVYMIGDSLTSNAPWSEFFPRVKIANRGIAGDGVAGVLARVDQIPDGAAMLLMIGTNDVGFGSPIEQTEKTYATIINALSPKGRLLVQSTLFTTYAGRNAKISRLNAYIRSICETSGCEFIDLNASMAPDGRLPEAFTLDGLHLNDEGYAAWRKVIGPIIVDIVSTAAS